MKQSKKFLSIILAIIVFVICIPINVTAANAQVTLTADKTNVNVGDKVVVTVALAEKSGLGTLTIKANYDSSVLKAVEMKAGTLGATVNAKTGIATMAAAETFEEAGTICVMTFEALKAGTANVTFTVYEATDANFNAKTVDVNSVKVTVVENAPTLTVVADKSYVDIGDEVRIMVNLSEKSGLGTLCIKVCYDSRVLRPVNMYSGDLGATVNANTCVATMATATTYEEAGSVCRVVFEAISSGSCKLYLDVQEASDADYNNVQVETNTIFIEVFETTTEPDDPCTYGHTWSTWAVEKVAECKKDGVKARNCTVCGEKETEVIPATGECAYKWIITKEPTNTEYGEKQLICVMCGYIKETQELAKLKCEVHEEYTEFEINVPATCAEDGLKTKYCIRCDHAESEIIPAIGHDYVWYRVNAPTCEEDGVNVGQCSVCENIKFEGIPATGHKYETVVTAPTCTEQGYTTYTCFCGDTYNDNYVNALGHTRSSAYEENYIAPTCQTNGSIEIIYNCTVCYIEISRETVVINATGHNYVAFTIFPTCTEKGYTTYTCSCGDSYVDNYTDATGHTDKNGDGYCDSCPEILDPTINCGCNCHKSGIKKFFFNFALFFQKVFGANKTCGCGVAHY